MTISKNTRAVKLGGRMDKLAAPDTVAEVRAALGEVYAVLPELDRIMTRLHAAIVRYDRDVQDHHLSDDDFTECYYASTAGEARDVLRLLDDMGEFQHSEGRVYPWPALPAARAAVLARAAASA